VLCNLPLVALLSNTIEPWCFVLLLTSCVGALLYIYISGIDLCVLLLELVRRTLVKLALFACLESFTRF